MDAYCSNPFSQSCKKKCDDGDDDCEGKCDKKFKNGSKSVIKSV